MLGDLATKKRKLILRKLLEAISHTSADLKLADETVYIGTNTSQVSSMLEGSPVKEVSVWGEGLYLFNKHQEDGAISHAVRNEKSNEVAVVLKGRFNPARKLRVGVITIDNFSDRVKKFNLQKLVKGFFPIDWHRDPVLQECLRDHFDMLIIRLNAQSHKAIESYINYVLYPSDEIDAILWESIAYPTVKGSKEYLPLTKQGVLKIGGQHCPAFAIVPVFANIIKKDIHDPLPPVKLVDASDIEEMGFSKEPDCLNYVILENGQLIVAERLSALITLQPSEAEQYSKRVLFLAAEEGPRYLPDDYIRKVNESPLYLHEVDMPAHTDIKYYAEIHETGDHVYFTQDRKPICMRVLLKHAEVAGLQPVIAAGDVYVQKGKIYKINTRTGHYLVHGLQLKIIIETKFRGHGYSLPKTRWFRDIEKMPMGVTLSEKPNIIKRRKFVNLLTPPSKLYDLSSRITNDVTNLEVGINRLAVDLTIRDEDQNNAIYAGDKSRLRLFEFHYLTTDIDDISFFVRKMVYIELERPVTVYSWGDPSEPGNIWSLEPPTIRPTNNNGCVLMYQLLPGEILSVFKFDFPIVNLEVFVHLPASKMNLNKVRSASWYEWKAHECSSFAMIEKGRLENVEGIDFFIEESVSLETIQKAMRRAHTAAKLSKTLQAVLSITTELVKQGLIEIKCVDTAQFSNADLATMRMYTNGRINIFLPTQDEEVLFRSLIEEFTHAAFSIAKPLVIENERIKHLLLELRQARCRDFWKNKTPKDSFSEVEITIADLIFHAPSQYPRYEQHYKLHEKRFEKYEQHYEMVAKAMVAIALNPEVAKTVAAELVAKLEEYGELEMLLPVVIQRTKGPSLYVQGGPSPNLVSKYDLSMRHDCESGMSLRSLFNVEVPVFGNTKIDDIHTSLPSFRMITPADLEKMVLSDTGTVFLKYVILRNGQLIITHKHSALIPITAEQVECYSKRQLKLTPVVNSVNGIYYTAIASNGDIIYYDQLQNPTFLRYEMKHPEIAGNEPVLMAGDVEVRERKIHAITNWTGHYLVNGQYQKQIVETIFTLYGYAAIGRFFDRATKEGCNKLPTKANIVGRIKLDGAWLKKLNHLFILSITHFGSDAIELRGESNAPVIVSQVNAAEPTLLIGHEPSASMEDFFKEKRPGGKRELAYALRKNLPQTSQSRAATTQGVEHGQHTQKTSRPQNVEVKKSFPEPKSKAQVDRLVNPAKNPATKLTSKQTKYSPLVEVKPAYVENIKHEIGALSTIFQTQLGPHFFATTKKGDLVILDAHHNPTHISINHLNSSEPISFAEKNPLLLTQQQVIDSYIQNVSQLIKTPVLLSPMVTPGVNDIRGTDKPLPSIPAAEISQIPVVEKTVISTAATVPPPVSGLLPTSGGNPPPVSGLLPTSGGNPPPVIDLLPTSGGNPPPVIGLLPSSGGNPPPVSGLLPSSSGNPPPVSGLLLTLDGNPPPGGSPSLLPALYSQFYVKIFDIRWASRFARFFNYPAYHANNLQGYSLAFKTPLYKVWTKFECIEGINCTGELVYSVRVQPRLLTLNEFVRGSFTLLNLYGNYKFSQAVAPNESWFNHLFNSAGLTAADMAVMSRLGVYGYALMGVSLIGSLPNVCDENQKPFSSKLNEKSLIGVCRMLNPSADGDYWLEVANYAITACSSINQYVIIPAKILTMSALSVLNPFSSKLYAPEIDRRAVFNAPIDAPYNYLYSALGAGVYDRFYLGMGNCGVYPTSMDLLQSKLFVPKLFNEAFHCPAPVFLGNNESDFLSPGSLFKGMNQSQSDVQSADMREGKIDSPTGKTYSGVNAKDYTVSDEEYTSSYGRHLKIDHKPSDNRNRSQLPMKSYSTPPLPFDVKLYSDGSNFIFEMSFPLTLIACKLSFGVAAVLYAGMLVWAYEEKKAYRKGEEAQEDTSADYNAGHEEYKVRIDAINKAFVAGDSKTLQNEIEVKIPGLRRFIYGKKDNELEVRKPRIKKVGGMKLFNKNYNAHQALANAVDVLTTDGQFKLELTKENYAKAEEYANKLPDEFRTSALKQIDIARKFATADANYEKFVNKHNSSIEIIKNPDTSPADIANIITDLANDCAVVYNEQNELREMVKQFIPDENNEVLKGIGNTIADLEVVGANLSISEIQIQFNNQLNVNDYSAAEELILKLPIAFQEKAWSQLNFHKELKKCSDNFTQFNDEYNEYARKVNKSSTEAESKDASESGEGIPSDTNNEPVTRDTLKNLYKKCLAVRLEQKNILNTLEKIGGENNVKLKEEIKKRITSSTEMGDFMHLSLQLIEIHDKYTEIAMQEFEFRNGLRSYLIKSKNEGNFNSLEFFKLCCSDEIKYALQDLKSKNNSLLESPAVNDAIRKIINENDRDLDNKLSFLEFASSIMAVDAGRMSVEEHREQLKTSEDFELAGYVYLVVFEDKNTALSYFLISLEKDNTSFNAAIGAADIYADKGRIDEAARVISSVKMDPEDVRYKEYRTLSEKFIAERDLQVAMPLMNAVGMLLREYLSAKHDKNEKYANKDYVVFATYALMQMFPKLVPSLVLWSVSRDTFSKQAYLDSITDSFSSLIKLDKPGQLVRSWTMLIAAAGNLMTLAPGVPRSIKENKYFLSTLEVMSVSQILSNAWDIYALEKPYFAFAYFADMAIDWHYKNNVHKYRLPETHRDIFIKDIIGLLPKLVASLATPYLPAKITNIIGLLIMMGCNEVTRDRRRLGNIYENIKRSLLYSNDIRSALERYVEQPGLANEFQFVLQSYKLGDLKEIEIGRVDPLVAIHMLLRSIAHGHFQNLTVSVQSHYIGMVKQFADNQDTNLNALTRLQLKAKKCSSYADTVQSMGMFVTAEEYRERLADASKKALAEAINQRTLFFLIKDWLVEMTGIGTRSLSQYENNNSNAAEAWRAQLINSNAALPQLLGNHLYRYTQTIVKDKRVAMEQLNLDINMAAMLSYLLGDKVVFVNANEVAKFNLKYIALGLIQIITGTESSSLQAVAISILKTFIHEKWQVYYSNTFHAQDFLSENTKAFIQTLNSNEVTDNDKRKVDLLERILFLSGDNSGPEYQPILDDLSLIIHDRYFVKVGDKQVFKSPKDYAGSDLSISELYLQGVLLFKCLMDAYKGNGTFEYLLHNESEVVDEIIFLGYLPRFKEAIADYFSEKCGLRTEQVNLLIDRYDFSGDHWTIRKKYQLLSRLYKSKEFNKPLLSIQELDFYYGSIVRDVLAGMDKSHQQQLSVEVLDLIYQYAYQSKYSTNPADLEVELIAAIKPKLQQGADPSHNAGVENELSTLVMKAMIMGWGKLAALLCDYGALIRTENPNDLTPWKLCHSNLVKDKPSIIACKNDFSVRMTPAKIADRYPSLLVSEAHKNPYVQEELNIQMDSLCRAITSTYGLQEISDLLTIVNESLPTKIDEILFVANIPQLLLFVQNQFRGKPSDDSTRKSIIVFCPLQNNQCFLLLIPSNLKTHKPSVLCTEATMPSQYSLLSHVLNVSQLNEYKPSQSITVNYSGTWLVQMCVSLMRSQGEIITPCAETDPALLSLKISKQIPLLLKHSMRQQRECHKDNQQTGKKYTQTNSGFLVAAKKNKTEIAELLFKGQDINEFDGDQLTALHWAVIYGYGDLMEYLIRNKINVEAKGRNDTYLGRTPLAWAAYYERKELLIYLLKQGADPTACDAQELTPLQLAEDYTDTSIKTLLGNQLLILACQRGDMTEVKALIAKGYDVNSEYLCEAPHVNKPLHQNLLPGHTPLTIASANGHREIVALLLEKGALVNNKGAKKRTALGWAAWNGKISAIKCLLTHNADLFDADEDNKSPLHNAQDNKHADCIIELESIVSNKLAIAVYDNDSGTVKKLLNIGANPSTQFAAAPVTDHVGMSFLFYAIHRKYFTIAIELLIHGAKPDEKVEQGLWIGWSPLARLIFHHTEMDLTLVSLLLNKGASPSFIYPSMEYQGYSLLQYLSEMLNDYDVVFEASKLLVYKGAAQNNLLPHNRLSLLERLTRGNNVHRELLKAMLEKGWIPVNTTALLTPFIRLNLQYSNQLNGITSLPSSLPLYQVDLYRQKNKDIINLWLEANDHFFNNRYTEASKVYKRILEKSPENPYALYFIARCHYHLQDPSAALELLAQANRLDPREADFILFKANLHFERGEFTEAIEGYQTLIEIRPYAPEHYNSLGCSYMRIKNHASAATCFTKAIQLSPKVGMYYNNRAQAYLEREQYAEAETDFMQAEAFKLTVENLRRIDARGAAWGTIGAHFAKAYQYKQLRSYVEALKEITAIERLNNVSDAFKNNKLMPLKALLNASQDALEQNAKGTEYYTNSQFEAAYTCYTAAIAGDQNHAVYHNNQAHALLKLNRFEAAIKAFEKADEMQFLQCDSEVSKKNGLAWGKLGVYYAKALLNHHTKHYNEAMAFVEKAEREFPDNTRFVNTVLKQLKDDLILCIDPVEIDASYDYVASLRDSDGNPAKLYFNQLYNNGCNALHPVPDDVLPNNFGFIAIAESRQTVLTTLLRPENLAKKNVCEYIGRRILKDYLNEVDSPHKKMKISSYIKDEIISLYNACELNKRALNERIKHENSRLKTHGILRKDQYANLEMLILIFIQTRVSHEYYQSLIVIKNAYELSKSAFEKFLMESAIIKDYLEHALPTEEMDENVLLAWAASSDNHVRLWRTNKGDDKRIVLEAAAGKPDKNKEVLDIIHLANSTYFNRLLVTNVKFTEKNKAVPTTESNTPVIIQEATLLKLVKPVPEKLASTPNSTDNPKPNDHSNEPKHATPHEIISEADQAAKYNQQGLEFYENQQYQKALECFKSATTKNVICAMYHHNLAQVYLKLEQYKNAATTFQRSVEFKFTETEITAIQCKGEAWGRMGGHYAMALHNKIIKLWSEALLEIDHAKKLAAGDAKFVVDLLKPLRSTLRETLQKGKQAANNGDINALPHANNAHALFTPKKTADEHLYTDDEINPLLNYYLANESNIEISCGIDAQFNSGDALISNLDSITLQQVMRRSLGESSINTLVIPLNLSKDNHWVGLCISFTGTDRTKPTIHYIDPLGIPISETLKSLLTTVYPNINRETDIKSNTIRYQNDSYNCGPWTVAILENLVKTSSYLPKDFSINERRANDMKLIERNNGSVVVRKT